MNSLLKQIDDLNYGEVFHFNWRSLKDMHDLVDTMKYVVCDMNIVEDSTFTLSKSRLNRLVRISKKKNPELNTYLWRIKQKKCLVCGEKTTTTVCGDCVKPAVEGKLNRCSKNSCDSVIPFGWNHCICHDGSCSKTGCDTRVHKYTPYQFGCATYCNEHKIRCIECNLMLGLMGSMYDTKSHCFKCDLAL